MTEYNPVEMWRKSLSPADLDVHRGGFLTLYARRVRFRKRKSRGCQAGLIY